MIRVKHGVTETPLFVWTEEIWATCVDPSYLLRHSRPGGVSGEAARLFACAAARRRWEPFTDSRCQRVFACAERYALGLAGKQELAAARKEAEAALFAASVARTQAEHHESELRYGVGPCGDEEERPRKRRHHKSTLRAARRAAANALETAQDLCVVCEFARACTDPESGEALFNRGSVGFGPWLARDACDILRDLLGNPFRPFTFDPAWVHSEARRLAISIATSRQFEDLPILADALEEAGCTDETILRHCREPGVHVSGCWVLNTVLRS
jgi:hypothetical protein